MFPNFLAYHLPHYTLTTTWFQGVPCSTAILGFPSRPLVPMLQVLMLALSVSVPAQVMATMA